MMTTTKTAKITAPMHKTTVDQHIGIHEPTGMTETRLTDIITRFSDYSQESWESLSREDQEWWAEVLEDIHAAECEQANLEPEHRERVAEWLLDEHHELDNCAPMIRRAIKATAQPDA